MQNSFDLDGAHSIDEMTSSLEMPMSRERLDALLRAMLRLPVDADTIELCRALAQRHPQLVCRYEQRLSALTLHGLEDRRSRPLRDS